MSRRLALLAVVLAMVSAWVVVATPASAAGTGRVSGVVTGPGGVPLQGVEVDIYPQFPTSEIVWGAVTGATGAYEIPNLAAGDYKLLFAYPNVNGPYQGEWYDDAFDETSADVVSVADGAAVAGIDAELAAGASVAGRFTTLAGVGISEGVVSVDRLAVDGLYPPFYGTVATDSNGYYLVRGLPPGTYRLSFHDTTSGLTEFWNDKASFDAADNIVLASGQARSGFDAVLGITPPPLPAIVNTEPPKVGYQGRTAPQVGYPLTASRGYWTPGGVVVKDQWLLDGQPIPGATSDVYTPTLADVGRTLAVTATASQMGYVSATATSLPTNPVSKQVQNVKRPLLKGTPQVGSRLTVKPGSWRPIDAVTFRYRWYADGHRIRGARDDQLRLTSALKGTRVFCRVTGSAPGLHPLIRRTHASASIKR
jgi:hypothetical protein